MLLGVCCCCSSHWHLHPELKARGLAELSRFSRFCLTSVWTKQQQQKKSRFLMREGNLFHFGCYSTATQDRRHPPVRMGAHTGPTSTFPPPGHCPDPIPITSAAGHQWPQHRLMRSTRAWGNVPKLEGNSWGQFSKLNIKILGNLWIFLFTISQFSRTCYNLWQILFYMDFSFQFGCIYFLPWLRKRSRSRVFQKGFAFSFLAPCTLIPRPGLHHGLCKT